MLAALLISQTDLAEETTLRQVIIKVLPDSYTIEGYTGTDVVAVLANVISQSDSGRVQLMLSASSEVEYTRLQDALNSLHNAGYSNIGLSSEVPDAH